MLDNVLAGATVKARAGFVAALFGLPRSDRDERRLRDDAMAYLDRLGIAAYAQALPTTLPFALQKRVALARALIAEPRLLLLDEPAAGLAHDEIDDFAALIRGLPGTGTSVMLVEHHMDLVMAVCDDIVVLDFGKVIARGTPAEIRESGAVTAAYLGQPGQEHGRSGGMTDGHCWRFAVWWPATPGQPVLHEVDLDVPEGVIVAVLGANGAGKTTLLRTISGLHQAAGRSDPVRRRRDRWHRGRTDRAVRACARARGRRRDHRAHRRGEPASRRVCGAPTTPTSRPRPTRSTSCSRSCGSGSKMLGQQLSGGERQMLAIGRALVARPKLLLLDEPSLGLAPRITTQIMELLRRLCDERGLTVLLVEQNVRAALAVAHHGVILGLGRIARTTTAAELLGDDQLSGTRTSDSDRPRREGGGQWTGSSSSPSMGSRTAPSTRRSRSRSC